MKIRQKLTLENVKKIIKSGPSDRNIIRYKLLSSLARRYGWSLHSPDYASWSDTEYKQVIAAGGYETNDKKYMIFQLAKGVSNVEADTAECGIYKGYGSWLMLHADQSTSNTHHVFDSFEGVSEPQKVDNLPDANVFKWKTHAMAYPMDKVKARFADFPRVKYYKGWFPTRFSEVAHCRFKFVHVDVDLYDPTYQSFEFFYDKVIPGGIILCDDYARPGTPGAHKAVNDFMKDKPEKVIKTVPGSGFIIKQ